jgi:hypothetical protein
MTAPDPGQGAASSSVAPAGAGTTSAATAGRRLDPLALLRQCLIAKKKVHWAEDYLDFDGRRIHRNTKCGYKLPPTDNFIDIGSIWYVFHEISSDRPYTQETAKRRGFQYIGVASRGDLLDFLIGRADTCPGVAHEVLTGRKRLREEQPAVESRRMKATSQSIADDPAIAEDHAPGSEITYSDVVARVRPVKDLDVLVRAPGRTVPNADLILKIAQDEVKDWYHRLDRKPQQPKPAIGHVPLLHELEQFIYKDASNRPIILVPCNKNAPVNLLNAKALLQDGEYWELDELRLRYFESTRPEYVELVRNVLGKMWTFEIHDSAKNFTKNQWLRVVAIVTDGSDWQFKGWPFETITDMFSTIQGVYFNPVGELPPVHVTQWAVDVLNMATTQFQHRFAHIRDTFWIAVEKFLRSKRERKFVNHTSINITDRVVVKQKAIL